MSPNLNKNFWVPIKKWILGARRYELLPAVRSLIFIWRKLITAYWWFSLINHLKFILACPIGKDSKVIIIVKAKCRLRRLLYEICTEFHDSQKMYWFQYWQAERTDSLKEMEGCRTKDKPSKIFLYATWNKNRRRIITAGSNLPGVINQILEDFSLAQKHLENTNTCPPACHQSFKCTTIITVQ